MTIGAIMGLRLLVFFHMVVHGVLAVFCDTTGGANEFSIFGSKIGELWHGGRRSRRSRRSGSKRSGRRSGRSGRREHGMSRRGGGHLFNFFGSAGEVRGEDGLGGVPHSLWLKSALHPKKRGDILVFPGAAFLCGRVLIHIVSVTAEGPYEGMFPIEACGKGLICAPDQGQRSSRRKKGS